MMMSQQNSSVVATLSDYLSQTVLTQTHLALAVSGGMDSMVLLHCAVLLRKTHFPALTFTVLHVNHHLQSSANSFSKCVADYCELHQLAFIELSISMPDARGQSLEAIAREVRYRACFEAMHSMGLTHLFTAHHASDQVETFLLQLCRGAGTKGLSAMPSLKRVESYSIHRPFLSLSRELLQAYAEEVRLRWCDDPMNQDEHFDRNFLRHTLLPLLKTRFPGVEKTIFRSVFHLQEAQQLLEELARIDEVNVFSSHNINEKLWGCPVILVSALQRLSSLRVRNLLRYWLSKWIADLPSTQKMQSIEKTLIHSHKSRQGKVYWGDYALYRYREHLYLIQTVRRSTHPTGKSYLWAFNQSFSGPPWCFPIDAERRAALASAQDRVEIFFRSTEQRILLGDQGHHILLKKYFQQMGVPPWLRDQIPFVKVNGFWRAILLPEQTLLLKSSDTSISV